MQDAVRKIPHKIIFIESIRDTQRDKSSILFSKAYLIESQSRQKARVR